MQSNAGSGSLRPHTCPKKKSSNMKPFNPDSQAYISENKPDGARKCSKFTLFT